MQLNLPDFNIKTRKTKNNKIEIFDVFRKKYVLMTPEEWVRQHFLHYLVNFKNYPQSLVSVERGLIYNKIHKRFDAVIFDKHGSPEVLIEFKAPKIKLDQKVFDQAALYNFNLKVSHLIVSNGLEHYCCKMDYTGNTYNFLKEIPDFNAL